MKRLNDDIREYAKDRGVKLWEVSVALGKNDGNFSRELRKPLSEARRSKIMRIIRNISENREFERKPNQDVLNMAKSKNVCLWQIGERLGVNDGNLSRKLRKELNEKEKQKVKRIIQEIYLENAKYC